MSLSVENKKFLAVLNKLGINVKEFPDLTFDGLFENVPEDTNYFFDWFIENVTTENALSKKEKEIYFQLETSESLPSDEEMNRVFSSCDERLDLNVVENNIVRLSKDLDELKKYKSSLSNKAKEAESLYGEVKKKQDSLREDVSNKKKLFSNIKQDSQEMNLVFGNTIDNVSKFLLEEPSSTPNLSIFKELVSKEKDILNRVQSSQSMNRNTFICSGIDFLNELSSDLLSVDMSMILSEGFLKARKAKIEFLSEILQGKTSCKSISVLCHNEMCNEINEEIKHIELELLGVQKQLSHGEVQKILDEYLVKKTGLNVSYLKKLTEVREYTKSTHETTINLEQILLKWMKHVGSVHMTKKELLSKIIEYETNLNNNIISIELRSQRYKEIVLHQDQHPLLVSLGNLDKLDEVVLKKMMQLMSHVNDFSSTEVQNKLQSSIKMFFDDVLCGPTFQILFTPAELLIKFQECIKHNEQLSHMVKQLANHYVDAKKEISMSERQVAVVNGKSHKC